MKSIRGYCFQASLFRRHADPNLFPFDLHGIGLDLNGRIDRGATRLQIKFPSVPWTGQNHSLDGSGH